MFNRGDRPNILKKLPAFIASKTDNHFSDFVDCLGHNPSSIFIEKGFQNKQEKIKSKELAGDIPVYFLSQYRFSSVIDKFLAYKETIVSMKYTWQVEQHAAQEWLYHIISLDNYIKGLDNELYINDYGSYNIDAISQVEILKNNQRHCKIDIETIQSDYTIELGKANKIIRENLVIKHQDNEDCLGKQISEIFTDSIEKLERL